MSFVQISFLPVVSITWYSWHASNALGLTRAAAVFGGLLILEYQKSSAAKASHIAGAGG
jgi:hypothetical protein